MKDLTTCYLLVINILAFILFYVDKVKAIKAQWRIPEKTLMTIAIIGGSIGSLIAMRLFRHKTRHPKFYLGIPCVLILQLLISYYIYIGV